jgi:hypothetical protein
VERETAEFEADYLEMEDHPSVTNRKTSEERADAASSTATVGLANNLQDSSMPIAPSDTNPELVSALNTFPRATDSVDASKDQGDDGGEIIFEGEDTVIY